MKTGIALARQMREMNFPDQNTRELRAMFMAQAIAYAVPLCPESTFEDLHAKHEKAFLDILNDVNETVMVDTRLARQLFRRLLQVRMELLMGVGDVRILEAALASSEQSAQFGPDDRTVLRAMMSRRDFIAEQHTVRGILEGYFTDGSSE